jgi:hypothetical protein
MDGISLTWDNDSRFLRFGPVVRPDVFSVECYLLLVGFIQRGRGEVLYPVTEAGGGIVGFLWLWSRHGGCKPGVLEVMNAVRS